MKKFNYNTGIEIESGNLKTAYIEAVNLEQAREAIKAFGAPVDVASAALVLEEYKGHEILDWDGMLTVYDQKAKTRFIVALDDSKTGGKRKFIDKYNNIKGAKAHIDWVEKVRFGVATYYFQIKEGELEWSAIIARPINFKLRSEAVTFAKNLARLFWQEVRLSDNDKLAGGHYFHPAD